MIAELGHLAVIIAFMVAIVQSVVPMIGASKVILVGWMQLGLQQLYNFY